MPGVPPARYAYLGPEGTFAEAALRTLPQPRRPTCSRSAASPLPSTRSGPARPTTRWCPIENSVEGSVSATLDELAAGDPLMVTREVLLPVSFALMVRPGTGHARRTPGGDPPARRTPSAGAGWRPCCRTPSSCPRCRRPRPRRPRRRDRDARRRDRRSDRGRALPARGARQRRRGQPRRRDAVRAGRPAGPAAAAERARQDVARRVHLRRPPGRAARGAHRVRRTRRQPDPHRVAADRQAAGPLLLLHRLRGSRRRRPGRRGAVRAAPGLPRRPVPRLLPARRRRPGSRGVAAPGQGARRGLPRRRRLAGPHPQRHGCRPARPSGVAPPGRRSPARSRPRGRPRAARRTRCRGTARPRSGWPTAAAR